jgi:hypothetical protein
MRGMTCRDDEIGLRETSTLRQCGTNAPNDASLPCDQNTVDVTCHTPLHRFGEAKRLVFMAGLAVADQPKCKCAFRHGDSIRKKISSFKNAVEALATLNYGKAWLAWPKRSGGNSVLSREEEFEPQMDAKERECGGARAWRLESAATDEEDDSTQYLFLLPFRDHSRYSRFQKISSFSASRCDLGGFAVNPSE